MSCISTYNSLYGDGAAQEDNLKILGSIVDDGSGEACVIPKMNMQLFEDTVPGIRDTFSFDTCKVGQYQLDKLETGCRINLKDMGRDEAKVMMTSIQAAYEKNVMDKIRKLTAERDRIKKEYETNLAAVKKKTNDVNDTLGSYFTELNTSNTLAAQKVTLREELTDRGNELASLKLTCEDMKKALDEMKVLLNKKVDEADKYLGFVTFYQDCDYKGSGKTLTVGSYTPEPDLKGISSTIIPPGIQLQLWTNANFQGSSKILSKDSPREHRLCLKNLKEHFIVPFVTAGMAISNSIKKKKAEKRYRNANFNDNVRSIQITRVQSVGDFIDTWDPELTKTLY